MPGLYEENYKTPIEKKSRSKFLQRHFMFMDRKTPFHRAVSTSQLDLQVLSTLWQNHSNSPLATDSKAFMGKHETQSGQYEEERAWRTDTVSQPDGVQGMVIQVVFCSRR